MIATTCCFTGHRALPAAKLPSIIANLSREIDALIERGVTDFLCGGALGFDQLAASVVLEKKAQGKPARLLLALPCKNQDAYWSAQEKESYRLLLDAADVVHCVSEEYDSSCMRRRNEYLVAHSAHCICALLDEKSGTGQTVRLARKKGLEIVHVLGES